MIPDSVCLVISYRCTKVRIPGGFECGWSAANWQSCGGGGRDTERWAVVFWHLRNWLIWHTRSRFLHPHFSSHVYFFFFSFSLVCIYTQNNISLYFLYLGNSVRLFGKKKVEGKKAGGASLLLPKVRRNPLIEIISINTGCLNQCSYCKTKHARGELGSYPIGESLVLHKYTLGLMIKIKFDNSNVGYGNTLTAWNIKCSEK